MDGKKSVNLNALHARFGSEFTVIFFLCITGVRSLSAYIIKGPFLQFVFFLFLANLFLYYNSSLITFFFLSLFPHFIASSFWYAQSLEGVLYTARRLGVIDCPEHAGVGVQGVVVLLRNTLAPSNEDTCMYISSWRDDVCVYVYCTLIYCFFLLFFFLFVWHLGSYR